MRAKGLSISVSGLFVATIVFLQVAPTAFDAISWKYYLVFIAISAILFVTIWFWFPETRQQSLEEIGAVFGDDVDIFDTKTHAIEHTAQITDENEKETGSQRLETVN